MAPQALTSGKPLLLILAGPTASGKSDVAFLLAKRLKGEIVNCDAMQVYRGMDIGTAKPSKTDRRRIPHHLLDIATPKERMNAERFSKLARTAIEGIASRGKVPILTGGSGLYLRSTVDGIFPGIGRDPKLRRKLEKSLGRQGPERLHLRLKKTDPEAASRIHPNDGRRIVRALEVYEKTGKPISFLQKTREGIGSHYRILWFGLLFQREELYRRINERVDAMFGKGLLGEVKRLRKSLGPTSRRALGYTEVLSYLKGEIPLERVIELVKRNSRRYAKRQLVWFRADKRIRWIPVARNETPRAVANRILARLRSHV